MSDENAPFVATLKAGTGYDAPWIVVRGNTAKEIRERLAELSMPGHDETTVIQTTVEAANFLKAANNAGPVLAGGAPAQAAPPAAPPLQAPAAAPPQQGGWSGRPFNGGGQQAAPAGEVRLHPAGQQCQGCGQVLQFKDVFSRAKNKSFQFWACPAQQRNGDGHDSIFAN